jgi:heme-degrading monooxygenase HmoA
VEGEDVYTVIRRYEGVTDADEVVKRATEEFGPMLKARPGFQGYYLLKGAGGVVASISVFDSKEEAEASIPAAAEWVRDRLADLAPFPPEITAGETSGVTP